MSSFIRCLLSISSVQRSLADVKNPCLWSQPCKKDGLLNPTGQSLTTFTQHTRCSIIYLRPVILHFPLWSSQTWYQLLFKLLISFHAFETWNLQFHTSRWRFPLSGTLLPQIARCLSHSPSSSLCPILFYKIPLTWPLYWRLQTTITSTLWIGLIPVQFLFHNS